MSTFRWLEKIKGKSNTCQCNNLVAETIDKQAWLMPEGEVRDTRTGSERSVWVCEVAVDVDV